METTQIDLPSYFTFMPMEDYIYLLNQKMHLADWKLVFIEVLRSYPNTPYLEVATQYLLLRLYNSNILLSYSPAAFLKKRIQEAQKGLLHEKLTQERLLQSLKIEKINKIDKNETLSLQNTLKKYHEEYDNDPMKIVKYWRDGNYIYFEILHLKTGNTHISKVLAKIGEIIVKAMQYKKNNTNLRIRGTLC